MFFTNDDGHRVSVTNEAVTAAAARRRGTSGLEGCEAGGGLSRTGPDALRQDLTAGGALEPHAHAMVAATALPAPAARSGVAGATTSAPPAAPGSQGQLRPPLAPG